jgi:hypothetical protein
MVVMCQGIARAARRSSFISFGGVQTARESDSTARLHPPCHLRHRYSALSPYHKLFHTRWKHQIEQNSPNLANCNLHILKATMVNPQPDDFDSLFNLEEEYYTEGYNLGVADGSRAGRIEGRLFGLEKGFEKFAAMGALAGRNAVWEARISDQNSTGTAEQSECKLPKLSGGARLQKHLQTLFALTEAESLSTENNEDSVSDFDDRLKRAEGKVKVIEKLVSEGLLVLETSRPAASGSANTQERRQIKIKRTDAGGESSMEDFNIRHART